MLELESYSIIRVLREILSRAVASRFLKNIILWLAPPLRRARDHIHSQNRVIETGRQDLAAAIAERDNARARIAELEARVEQLSAPRPLATPQAALDEIEHLKREVLKLEVAHHNAVELANDVLAQLPRLQRAR